MPFKSQNIRLPAKYDRRIKLTDDDKRNILKLYRQKIAIREIARRYSKVSRRTIQMVIFPERRERMRLWFKKHWREYYDRKKLTEATRKLRRYKHQLYKEGKI